MTFLSGHDFFDAIIEYGSLYTVELGLYVFQYSEAGSIAVYNVTPKYAEELNCQAKVEKCPWHALLGFGGYIYDAKLSDYYDKQKLSSEEWCNLYFDQGDWKIIQEH